MINKTAKDNSIYQTLIKKIPADIINIITNYSDYCYIIDFFNKYQHNKESLSSIQINKDYIDKFIDIYYDDIIWNTFIKYNQPTKYIIQQYFLYINWDELFTYQKQNMSFIKQYGQFTDLEIIIKYQHINEQYMRDNINNTYLINLALEHQKLSESYISDNLYLFDDYSWKLLSKYQKLTTEFIKKHYYMLDQRSISTNTNISNKIKKQLLPP